IWLVQALGFDELQPARSNLILPVLRRLARRRPLIIVVDLVLVVAAYTGSLALTGGREMTVPAAAAAVALTGSGQLGAFSLLGVRGPPRARPAATEREPRAPPDRLRRDAAAAPGTPGGPAAGARYARRAAGHRRRPPGAALRGGRSGARRGGLPVGARGLPPAR